MHIAVVGLSHRTAPVEIRERLSIPEQSMEMSLQTLRGNDQVLEAQSSAPAIALRFIPWFATPNSVLAPSMNS